MSALVRILRRSIILYRSIRFPGRRNAQLEEELDLMARRNQDGGEWTHPKRGRCFKLRTFPQFSRPSWTIGYWNGYGGSHRSRIPRRYIVCGSFVVVVCLCIIVVQVNYVPGDAGKGTDEEEPQVPPDPEEPMMPSDSTLHNFSRGAACADAGPCASVGRNILRNNGSAVDAAVGIMFCNGVVNYQSMGLGGGFFMTIYDHKKKKARTLDARDVAPRNASSDIYKEDPNLSKRGGLAVAVPGELKGYWEAHKKYGRLSWSQVIEPTIKVCEEGYNMTKHQYDSLNFDVKNIYKDPWLRKLFVNPMTGDIYPEGSLIKNTKLCNTLKIIAKEGADVFYTGSLADKFVEDVQKLGGIITKEDMENYHVRWKEPITTHLYGGETVYSMPPPGSGLILAFILNILDGYHFTPDSISTLDKTVTTYHRIAEAFKYAFAKRTELGDPDFVDLSKLMANLTSKEHGEDIRQKIEDDKTHNDPAYYGAVFYTRDDHGTSHVCVLAPNGDAVSVTSTVNIYFGASVTSEQTGILMNSGMDDFSIPGFKNFFNIPPSPANFIAPGKRALSSMCPSIVVDKNGDVILVIGASGGTKITTATAYVIIRNLWFGEDIKTAIDARRIHHQLYPMSISYEYGVLGQIVKELEKLGHKMTRYKQRGSVVCAVSKEGGSVYGNADFRKGGDACGF